MAMALPHARPLSMTLKALYRNMRCRELLFMPKLLRMPIMRVRSKTRIRSAVTILNRATMSMMTMTMTPLMSWVLSQSKSDGYRRSMEVAVML